MNRKVYLVGEIEKRFGSEFSIYSNSYSDIIKCIDCNRPGFKQYLLECHENGINFTINSAGKYIGEEDLLTPLEEGDITIAAIPAGSKSDGLKVVTAIIMIYIGIQTGGATGFMGFQSATAGQMIVSVGVSLAMQGIQGMLAPDPATDAEEDEGYLYTGGTNLIIEGDPVPLLYGELRVAGQPISLGVETYNAGAGGGGDLQYSTTGGIYGNAGATEVAELNSYYDQGDFR